jgi:hypothetical protein
MKALKGHALDRPTVWYSRYANNPPPHVRTARCQCGEESPPLSTLAERRQWHRNHKASVLVRRATGIEANQ